MLAALALALVLATGVGRPGGGRESAGGSSRVARAVDAVAIRDRLGVGAARQADTHAIHAAARSAARAKGRALLGRLALGVSGGGLGRRRSDEHHRHEGDDKDAGRHFTLVLCSWGGLLYQRKKCVCFSGMNRCRGNLK